MDINLAEPKLPAAGEYQQHATRFVASPVDDARWLVTCIQTAIHGQIYAQLIQVLVDVKRLFSQVASAVQAAGVTNEPGYIARRTHDVLAKAWDVPSTIRDAAAIAAEIRKLVAATAEWWTERGSPELAEECAGWLNWTDPAALTAAAETFAKAVEFDIKLIVEEQEAA